MFVVGSHVAKTTSQLSELLTLPDVHATEIDVMAAWEDRDACLAQVLADIQKGFDAGKTPVVFTSRKEIQFDSKETRLAFGLHISAFLMDVVRGLPKDLAYLVSKGGITSNDTLSKGLALRTSRILGQISTGCSVVQCPEDHPQYPHLPVVIFPGNVGGTDGLVEVFNKFQGVVAR